MRLPSSLLIAALFFIPSALSAQDHQHEHGGGEPERLGAVSFPTSCSADAQTKFTRAVALLHSFWYENAEKAFRDVAATDPQCGMAWWGVAMTNYHQVWPTPYSPAERARGMAAAEKAKAVGAKTTREQGYIDAIATFYRDADSVETRTRARAYEAAMERLASQFPDDDEAAQCNASPARVFWAVGHARRLSS